MKMSELPGRIHRCKDDLLVMVDNPTLRPKNDGISSRLINMQVGDVIVIPKSSGTLISRIARRMGYKYKNEHLLESFEIRVKRIK